MSRHVGIAVAAEVAEVSPATIRSWVHRGLLTRHPDGFDLGEVLARVDSRDPKMLALIQRRHERSGS